jgi:hypothetical protein
MVVVLSMPNRRRFVDLVPDGWSLCCKKITEAEAAMSVNEKE